MTSRLLAVGEQVHSILGVLTVTAVLGNGSVYETDGVWRGAPLYVHRCRRRPNLCMVTTHCNECGVSRVGTEFICRGACSEMPLRRASY